MAKAPRVVNFRGEVQSPHPRWWCSVAFVLEELGVFGFVQSAHQAGDVACVASIPVVRGQFQPGPCRSRVARPAQVRNDWKQKGRETGPACYKETRENCSRASRQTEEALDSYYAAGATEGPAGTPFLGKWASLNAGNAKLWLHVPSDLIA